LYLLLVAAIQTFGMDTTGCAGLPETLGIGYRVGRPAAGTWVAGRRGFWGVASVTNSATSTTVANSHAELRALWSLKERHRADGGWWSLSGFSIQATIALDRFVRRALIDGASEAYSFEALADLSVAGEKVGLTQVKRTLTRTTLAAAVREARTILDLCSPTFAQKVEFQVVCERDEAGLKPSNLTPLEVFQDPAATVADLGKILARFNPVEPVKVLSHPGLSLRRTLLSAGVRDPDRVAREALGTLFDAFDGQNRDGVERALMRALSDIRAQARTEDIVPGRLLTGDKFEPSATLGKNLFLGARPRLSDLVGGRFIDRRDVLAPLVETAQAWLSGLDNSYDHDDLRLPILWLEGRPGDGKSVLTLQLLEHLVLNAGRLSSVSELAGADELLAWVTSAKRRDAGDQAEIGFIDDLAAYVDRTGLDDLIDRAFYRGSPYVGLITCGTLEDGASFADSRRVALTTAMVGPPSTADFEGLRKWAERRLGRHLTGRHPEGISISDFVVGLALEPSDHSRAISELSKGLRAAMAVNALGIAAPRSLVDSAEMQAYAAARPDIELSPFEETSGVRLGHAEAIWRLYVDASGEEDLAEKWGSDLGTVLATRIARQEATEARALLGALISTKYAISRLRRSGSLGANAALLDAVYRAFTEGCAPHLRAPLLRLWLAAAAGKRLTAIDISALREEGRRLLASEGNPEDVKAEVAASLLLVGYIDDNAAKAASQFLRRAGPVPAAGKYAISVLSKSFKGTRSEVAMAWLTRNRQNPAAGEVLGRILRNEAPQKIQDLAFEYLNQFLGRPESGAVLTALATCHRTKQFYLLQDKWLARTDDAPRALGIYRDQLQSAHWPHYVDRAVAFIKLHQDIRGGQAVLSPLLRKQGGDSEVLAVAREWLDHFVGSALATPVLTELVAVRPLEASDLERALRHVDRAAPGSSSLFATLAVVLQPLSTAEITSLRDKLPRPLIGTFDQATSWKIQNLDGRLLELAERVRRAR
jgi:hypothetical protein